MGRHIHVNVCRGFVGTCTFFTQQNTQVDGSPLGHRSAAVRTLLVRPNAPQALTHSITWQRATYTLIKRLTPSLLHTLRLCRKTTERKRDGRVNGKCKSKIGKSCNVYLNVLYGVVSVKERLSPSFTLAIRMSISVTPRPWKYSYTNTHLHVFFLDFVFF